MTESQKKDNSALALSLAAFSLWGLMPAYWKLLHTVPASEVLAHRIIWSFVFMIFLVIITLRARTVNRDIKMLLAHRKKFICLIIAAILISLNWLLYIWAVNNDMIVESSLGYYMSPLFSVLVGVLILRERLSLWQLLAVILATVGVVYLTVNHGSFPWVAVALASSFTIYGLCKKVTGLSAISGMTLETALITPLVLLFLYKIYSQGQGYPISFSPTVLLLVASGVLTALPLIIFTYSLNRLPLSIIGILQYISPTISLFLGVYVYDEVFTQTHLTAFIFIWSGLILFSLARTTPMIKLEQQMSRLWSNFRVKS